MTQSAEAGKGWVSARALTVVFGAGIVWLVLPFVAGLIGAGVLYVIALPVVRRLAPSGRHRVAAIATMLGVLLLLVLPGIALLAELLSQIPDAARSVQLSPTFARIMALRIGELDVGSILRQASTEMIAWSSRQTITAVAGAVNIIINLVLALFGAYYLLTSADQLWERAKAALPFTAATSELLRTRFHHVTEAMLIGVVLTGAAQGTLVGLSFAALGLPQPVLWACVTAMASILPMFGSALVWGPAVLVLVAQDHFGRAMLLLSLGVLAISNIDNALRLIVYRRVSQVHPMVTLVGAFAGVRAFGVAGLLLGPLVLSYMLELIRIYRDNGAPIPAPAA